MKRMLCVLAVALAHSLPCAAGVEARLVRDDGPALTGAPYTGYLELSSTEAVPINIDCRLALFDPCLYFTIRKPSGSTMEVSASATGFSVSMGQRPQHVLEAGKALRVPVCLGIINNHFLFDSLGLYVVEAHIRYNSDLPEIVAQDSVRVSKKGQGYDDFCRVLREQLAGRILYHPCGWFVAGPERIAAALAALGPDTEYAGVMDRIFAYQIGCGTIRTLIEYARGIGDAPPEEMRTAIQNDVALGLSVSQRTGVNVAFWQYCAQALESIDHRAVKTFQSTTTTIWLY